MKRLCSYQQVSCIEKLELSLPKTVMVHDDTVM